MQLSTQVRGQGKTGLDFEEAYNVSNKNASRALNLILMPRPTRWTAAPSWRKTRSRRSAAWRRRRRATRRMTERSAMEETKKNHSLVNEQ